MRRSFTGLVYLLAAVTLPILAPFPQVSAQEPPVERSMLESQRRLDEVRQERRRLQSEMGQLQTRAQGASSRLRNAERQLSASRSVLAEVDFQIETRSAQVDTTTATLIETQSDLDRHKVTLTKRLRAIYMRGPLHTFKVLLGADSFSNLLSRYRYLQLIANYDRSLVDRMTSLEVELVMKNRDLQESLSELHNLRDDKVSEVSALRRVETQRQSTLDRYQTEVADTEGRLSTLALAEENLSDLLGDLESGRALTDRRAVISGGGGAGGNPTPENTEAAMGFGELRDASLAWPVEGELVYRFGRQRRPNGTVLRWNGIGIRAAPGTPVRAVLAGTVDLAGPFQGYGPMVVLNHGNGLYTLYLYLEDIGVVQGRVVAEGQVVGTVGGSDTPEGAHMEFQIRAPISGSPPQAMDPLPWLQNRGGM